MKKSRAFLCGILITLLLTAQAAAFTDTDGHWASASIERWSASGLINGYADGTFAPDATLTRGEMATILCRLFGWREQAENLFDDVEPQAWYTEYVLKANAAGVMLGDGNRMRPTDPITRQEAAVMLYRVLCLEAQKNTPVFPDSAQIADWAAVQVGTMAAMGYLNGMEDGTFRPLDNITRAQVVTILDRAVPALYSRAGAFSKNSAGTVIVSAPGVTLQNMKIEGDLILTPAAAGSETTLWNVQVSGRLIVQGKELQTIYLTGESSVNQIWAASAKTLLSAGQSVQVGSLFVTAPGARITGIPVGTPVKAAANVGEVFVNGQSFRAGMSAPAPAGSDSSFGVSIDVEIN